MPEYAWVLWDLAAVAILYICVRVCSANGFMRTIVSFLGYFAAAAFAWFSGPFAARFIYNNIVRGMLESALVSSFSGALESGGANGDLMAAMPGGLALLMGGGAKSLSAIAPQNSVELLAGAVIDSVLQDPVMNILNACCFLLLFTMTAFVIRKFAMMLTEIHRIPVIGTVNTVAGGIVGVFQGILILLIMAFLMRAAVSFSDGEWRWLNESIMGDTYIWRIFYF